MKSASLLLALLLCMPRIFAQHGEAVLTGIVRSINSPDTLKDFIIEAKHQESGKRFLYYSWKNDSAIGYRLEGLPTGTYNLYCFNFLTVGYQRIQNVVLKEGFNNWYPRLKESEEVEFVTRTPKYYPKYIFDSEDFPEFKPLSLYPNPVHETAALAEGECYNRVDIYNVSGNLLKTIHFEDGQEQKMELIDLPFGFYICKASSDKYGFSETVKFIKL